MRVLLTTVTLLLAVPAGAQATTVGLDTSGDEPVVRVADTEGVVNDLTVSGVTNVVTIGDTAAPLTAQAPCDQLQPGLVRCPIAGETPTIVELGGGDDTASGISFGGSVSLDGGDGADTLGPVRSDLPSLRGGPGDDVLTGGPNTDQLVGGPGADRMTGGGGADLLYPGPNAPFEADVVEGGDADDTVSYAGPGSVTVDLRQGIAFAGDTPLRDPAETLALADQAGTRATITGVERATGSDAADTLYAPGAGGALTGGRGADVLQGGAGDDVLTGDAGEDVLNGETGDDALLGGDGRDSIFAAAGEDRVTVGRGGAYADLGPDDDLVLDEIADDSELVCGDGDDAARSLAGGATEPDCERTLLTGGIAVARDLERVGTRRWRTSLRCVASTSATRCDAYGAVQLLATRGGRPLARSGRAFRLDLGRTRRATFAVSRATDARLRGGRRVRIRVPGARVKRDAVVKPRD